MIEDFSIADFEIPGEYCNGSRLVEIVESSKDTFSVNFISDGQFTVSGRSIKIIPSVQFFLEQEGKNVYRHEYNRYGNGKLLGDDKIEFLFVSKFDTYSDTSYYKLLRINTMAFEGSYLSGTDTISIKPIANSDTFIVNVVKHYENYLDSLLIENLAFNNTCDLQISKFISDSLSLYGSISFNNNQLIGSFSKLVVEDERITSSSSFYEFSGKKVQ